MTAMKPITAIFVCSLLAPSMSALAQIQVGPQYRGVYGDGVSIHTGGIAAEAHFPQGNWAWGIELEATTGPDLRYWTTAMLNAGLLVNRSYFYGSVGAGRFKARDFDISDSGWFYGIGWNSPLGRDFRADLSFDTDSSFDAFSTTTSIRYEFPTSGEKRRRRYSSGGQQPVRYAEKEPVPTLAVQEVVLDPSDTEKTVSMGEVDYTQPAEEVVVTATAPVHPMKIAIQEGCNVLSVKVVNESQVWDLFCPSTLKRISVTI